MSAVMSRAHLLEEKLRESACVGDVEAVQILLQKGVDVNAMHEINGWNALHWASKRGHREVVKVLLANGADISLRTKNKDSALTLCTNSEVRQLLLSEADESLSLEQPSEQRLPIIPHYLKHPPIADRVDIQETHHKSLVQDKISADARVSSGSDELVLKIRIANSGDPDFIEVELPKSDLSYSRLLRLCTEELDINPTHVTRVRKLPNTIVRNDKDVNRLQDGQEIELVVQPEGTSRLVPCSNGLFKKIPGSNTNGYQSISLNKNQTILY